MTAERQKMCTHIITNGWTRNPKTFPLLTLPNNDCTLFWNIFYTRKNFILKATFILKVLETDCD